MSQSAIDQALVSRLSADAALTTAAPGGVWWELAPQDAAVPYVVITLAEDVDEQIFRGTAYQATQYAIEAMDDSPSSSGVMTAYDRIHALLQDPTLTITGYTLLKCIRRRRYRSVIEDGDQRIQQCGGVYELWAQPTT
jgi:hypothetical protein